MHTAKQATIFGDRKINFRLRLLPMENNNIELPGFTITVRSEPAKSAGHGAVLIHPDEFAGKIADFIQSHIRTNRDTTVRLNIASWNETFDVEESVYDIHADAPTINTIDKARNYWIEIEDKHE